MAEAPPADPFGVPLVQRARAFAERAHGGQYRKGGDHVPYFTHLEAVAARLAQSGHSTPLELSAAFLHDVLEDQPAFEAELRATFPAELVAVVDLLTEKKLDADGRKRPKAVRFAEYLAGLRADTPTTRVALAVSCADKLENMLSLVSSEQQGMGLLGRLNTRPGQHRAQYAVLRGLYERVVHPDLLAAYDEAARALLEYIDRWLPGRAVSIAAEAHLGQFDKNGEPYIYHPLALLGRAETTEEKTVAVLHDVVEDSCWTLEQLVDEGFSPAVVEAVGCLTRRDGESYDAFIERIAENPLATRVKLLDLDHNLDESRLPDGADRAAFEPLFERYRRARTRLEQARALHDAGGWRRDPTEAGA